MTNSLLPLLMAHTYRRSDFSYRISLLRELAEFAFFTRRVTTIETSVIEDFLATTHKNVSDAEVLNGLAGALRTLTQQTLYDTLAELETGANALAVLTLSVPVSFAEADVAMIGEWVRREVVPMSVLEVVVDPRIIAGCSLVWQGRAYDYSFEQSLRKQQKPLQAQILARSGASGSIV